MQEGRRRGTGSSAPGAPGFSTFCPAHAEPGSSGDWHWSLGGVLSPRRYTEMQDFTARVSAQDKRRRLLLREEKGRRVCSLVMRLEAPWCLQGQCPFVLSSRVLSPSYEQLLPGRYPSPPAWLTLPLQSAADFARSPGPAPPASHVTSLGFSQVVHIFLLPDRCSHCSCCMFPPLLPGREPVVENSPKHISDVACHQNQKN